MRDTFEDNGQPARYYNPYEGVLMAKGGQRDNLFSLYRAEIQPYVFSEFGPRVNLALFQDEDEDNLVVCHLVKSLGSAAKVFARVNHPSNEWLFTPEWGVDVPIGAAATMYHLVEKERARRTASQPG